MYDDEVDCRTGKQKTPDLLERICSILSKGILAVGHLAKDMVENYTDVAFHILRSFRDFRKEHKAYI